MRRSLRYCGLHPCRRLIAWFISTDIVRHTLTSTSSLCVQLIVCGLGKIDINDWKSNTRLKHCTPDSNIVKWFWKAVESFDEERRARLLQFVTGSSRVPLQGFKALQGKISQSGNSANWFYTLQPLYILDDLKAHEGLPLTTIFTTIYPSTVPPFNQLPKQ